MSETESHIQTEPPEFNAAEFARRWKDVWQGDSERLERRGARQKQLIESAPEAWLRALVRELPPTTLWGFLNPKSKSDIDPLRLDLRHVALRGFQQTQSIMRQPVVQSRLVAWLDRHREVAHLFLLLWEGKNTEVHRTLGEEADEADIVRVLKKYGALASWLGAAYLGSERVFGEVERLISTPEIWENEEEESEVPPESPEDSDSGEPVPDSEAANFWHERAEQLQSELEIRTRELRLVQEENAEMATLRERLRAAQKDLDKARKEEKARETAWQKKLELAQKATQAQINELKKHDERETRRLHAAEKTRDELDSTVKVLRKQLRHLNQLLDEQQKKNSALQASLEQSEATKAKTESDAQAVGAASTPPATQKATNQPVKVARPTPLDELFRWVADGHEFRATARETMRHIDRGDTDFAFRAQLALEGIAPSDIAKKNAFLTRLREQDGYYVRVLTEPTQRALVDASNVVRSTKNRYGKGELRNLLGMITELRRLSFFPIELIADASLRHNVDQINAYNEMINRGEVEVVTPGTEADEVLVRKFRSGGGYVITNDTKFHFKVSPDLAPPSLSFRVSGGLVMVEDF
ncbi:hypothetical protein IAD21_05155 [Abditibacteriota bacterium]|nr:hypothetical protein IAD21_05155 [Abditibacteriota bacterium]